jgi:Histidine kinase-like ATPase domain
VTTDPTRRCELEFEAAPSRFGQVRRIVQAHLRYWRLDPLIDPAVLGITELLANVYMHARESKRCTVELAHLAGSLTVSVHDADPRLPVACAARPLEIKGRGMTIVAALSQEWGSRREETGGKVVWFTLSAEGAPRPRDPSVLLEPQPVRVEPEPLVRWQPAALSLKR